MANTYKVAERGHFEVWIIREGYWDVEDVAVAYTDGDEMRLTSDFRECDREEVEYWADYYDLNIVERKEA